MRIVSYILYLYSLPSCIASYRMYGKSLKVLAKSMSPDYGDGSLEKVEVSARAYIDRLAWASVEELYRLWAVHRGVSFYRESKWVESKIRRQSIYVRKYK
jgi:hypothetical protein